MELTNVIFSRVKTSSSITELHRVRAIRADKRSFEFEFLDSTKTPITLYLTADGGGWAAENFVSADLLGFPKSMLQFSPCLRDVVLHGVAPNAVVPKGDRDDFFGRYKSKFSVTQVHQDQSLSLKTIEDREERQDFNALYKKFLENKTGQLHHIHSDSTMGQLKRGCPEHKGGRGLAYLVRPDDVISGQPLL